MYLNLIQMLTMEVDQDIKMNKSISKIFLIRKLTYNFVTSKALKRGHNFGVVYFTPNSLEEELQGATVKKHKNNVIKTKQEVDNEKREKLYSDIIQPVKGREHVACGTEIVTTTIRPKPLSFDVEVQTEEYLDRPISPLGKPVYNNPSNYTQVEDGDLFNFDYEVAPILNVLVTKVLDQSRMEVLEEEEIRTIKQKQRYFEELRNRELMEVQKLEDMETRAKEEIFRRVNQQKEKTNLMKIHQKKLISRVFGREYLVKLKSNVMRSLIKENVFAKNISKDINYDIVPYINEKVEIQVKNNLKFVGNLHIFLRQQQHNNIKELHKKAIQDEIQRKADEEQRRKEEKLRRKEERKKKLEEELRQKKLQELEELKAQVFEDLMKFAELTDEINEIGDNWGNYQIGKRFATLTGGQIGQWALVISIINSINKDDPFMNYEKISKSIEIFMPKMPPITLSLSTQFYEEIKLKDEKIQNVEDISKLDDDQFVSFNKFRIQSVRKYY